MTDPEPFFTQSTPSLVPWPTPLTVSLRVKFFLTGIVYPIICLAFVIGGASPVFGDLWQNGQNETYIALILAAPAFLVFLPLIVFSMVGLGIWCVKPRLHQHHWIQLAIHTGVFLTIQFNLLLWCVTAMFSPVVGGIFLLAQAFVIWLASLVLKRSYRFTIYHLLILTTIIAVVLGGAMQAGVGWELLPIPGSVVACAFIGAPFMALVTFSRVSWMLFHLNRASIPGKSTSRKNPVAMVIIGLLAWIAAWLTTWKFAIDLALIEYSKLPVNPPPGCFVSAAAAGGHKKLVGTVHRRDGELVSLQMARCKMIELVLMAICPRVHAPIRKIYDVVGPKLAAACRKNVWTADLAFIALLPIEALAVVVSRIFKISEQRTRGLYRIPPRR